MLFLCFLSAKEQLVMISTESTEFGFNINLKYPQDGYLGSLCKDLQKKLNEAEGEPTDEVLFEFRDKTSYENALSLN